MTITVNRRQRARLLAVLRYALLVLGSVIFILPLLWMVSTSLRPTGEVLGSGLDLIPQNPQWSNYAKTMELFPFWQYALNSLFITTVATFGTVLSSSLVAYGFARCRFRGRRVLFAVLLGTMMLPPIVVLIPTFVLFSWLGWVNTFLPLTVPAFFAGSAFNVFLLRQFYASLPYEYDEAATIDGASKLRIWWSVILPMSKAPLAVVTVLSIVLYWNDFLGPLIYLRSSELLTLAVGLQYFQGQEQVQWNYLMCGATLMSIPLLALFFAAQRYFIEGARVSGLAGR